MRTLELWVKEKIRNDQDTQLIKDTQLTLYSMARN